MRNWLLRSLVITAGLLAGVAAHAEPTSAGALTFTVELAGDFVDTNPGNGVCEYRQGGPFPFVIPCTLRAAIMEANANPGIDTIKFDISQGGIWTITPATALPTITERVVIDGTTQPNGAPPTPLCIDVQGRPCILINGNGGAFDGLTMAANNIVIRGLAIYGFGSFNSGIMVTGPGGAIERNYIGTRDGTTDDGNGKGITVDANNSVDTLSIGGLTPLLRNVISGSTTTGVRVFEGAVLIRGNYIGTNAAGTAALANAHFGIEVHGTIFGTPTVQIGGTDPGSGNLISGNPLAGVRIIESDPGAEANAKLWGNKIGTDLTGMTAIANGLGVELYNGSSAEIGGPTTAHRNIISGNSLGVGVYSFPQGDAQDNVIEGNYIGLNANGTAALPNTGSGVIVFGDDDANTVNNAIVGNVISGNGESGVELQGSMVTLTNVFENLIGTDAAGSAPIGNGVGVRIRFGPSLNAIEGNTIVSSVVIATIAGNTPPPSGMGIFISGPDAASNTIRGNFIGTNAGGDDLGNAREGIHIIESRRNGIGGVAQGEGNVIRFNGAAGVHIEGADAIGNRVARNSIDDNGGLGIDLQMGANGELPAPELTSAETGSLRIIGVAEPDIGEGVSMTVEFFASPACDLSGFGEGRTYLGSVDYSTDANGDIAIDETLGVDVAPGSAITATLTEGSFGDSSEFSNCVTALAPATPTPTPTTPASATPTSTGQTPTPTGTGATPTPTGSATPLHGDANCDGEVDFDDVLAILEYVAELAGLPPCPNEADVNCDAVVNEQDALLIALYLAGVPEEPPNACPAIGG